MNIKKNEIRGVALASLSLVAVLFLFQNCSAGKDTTGGAATDTANNSSTGAGSGTGGTTTTLGNGTGVTTTTPGNSGAGAGATNATALTNCLTVFGTTVLNSCDGAVLLGAGMVGIGTASPTTQLDVNGSIAVANEKGGVYFKDNAGALDSRIYQGVGNNLNIQGGTGGMIKFMDKGMTVGAYFDAKGNWFTTGQYQNSDSRLKTDIKPLKGVLASLENVDGVTFDWKEEVRRKNEGQQVGVIAQNLQKSYPQLVKQSENIDSKSPLKTVLSVDYNHLTAVILAGLKELVSEFRSDSKRLHEDNERLLKRVADLEKRLDAIKAPASK